MVFKTILQAAKSILLPILVGALSGLLIQNNTGLYEVLILPPFALPGNLFPIVWGVLYLLMGIALYLFKRSDAPEKDKSEGTMLFLTQLALNFLWPIVFFNLKLPFAAFLLLIVLFVFIARTVMKFYQANRISGILLIPYLLYVIYAGYLNFAIWFLNM